MFRKIFFLFVIVLLGAVRVKAQMDIQIGYGTIATGGYPVPIQDDYEGSRAQYLYRATDLNSFGMTKGVISAIKFYVFLD